MGRLFQAFLEKNNIMWGELVGGLMIVGCSIALVISFWAEIAERPLLKFGIFNGVSAALFAVGFYTDRRWKIRTTSHGVLTIASLLAPLNFLAIAAFTEASPPTDLLSLAGEGLSLAMFAALTFFAARKITPLAPLATTVGVMAPSLMLLLTRRYVRADASPAVLNAFALAPISVFVAAAFESLRRTLAKSEADVEHTVRHLLALGLCLFAMLLPLALLLHMAGEVAAALRNIAPQLALVAAPLIATAMLSARRPGEGGAAVRVAGTSVGVLGGMLLVASLALSWPLPWALVTAAVINAVVAAVLARVCSFPRLNWLAAAGIATAWVVAFAVVAGEASWGAIDTPSLVRTLVSAATGARLTPVVALLTAVAFVCRRVGRRDDSREWALSAAAAAAVSLALLAWFGLGRVGDPAGAAWCIAAYAGLAVAASLLVEHRWLSWGASSLLLAALVQTLVFRYGLGFGDFSRWVLALLTHSTLCVAVASGAWWQRQTLTSISRGVFSVAGLATSLLAAAVAAGACSRLDYSFLAGAWLWIAALWLAISKLRGARELCVAFQGGLAAALSLSVTGLLSRQGWFQAASVPWIDPWYLQTLGVVLALYALAWRASRLAGVWLAARRGNAILLPLARRHWASVDRVLEVALVLSAVSLCLYACFPGAAVELSPSAEAGFRVPFAVATFEVSGLPAAHAAGVGSWALLAAVAALSTAGLWERGAGLRLMALLLLGGAGCALASAAFADQEATASALRWLLSAYAVAASVPILMRRRISPALDRLGVHRGTISAMLGESPSAAARGLVIGMVVLLYVAVVGFVSVSCIHTSGMPGESARLLAWLAGLAAVGGVGWLMMGAGDQVRTAEGGPASGLRAGRSVLAFTTIAPLLVVLSFVVATNLTERPLTGPDPTSWFAQIGPTVCYGGPLAVFALVLLAFAVRERSSQYAFAFGLLTSGVATLVFMLRLATDGRALDAVAWIEVLQVNAAVLAVTALAWRGAIAWNGGSPWSFTKQPILLSVQSMIALVFALQPLIAGCVGVFRDPRAIDWEQSVASPGGLAALALACLAVWLASRDARRPFTKHRAGGLALLTVATSTAELARFDSGQWLAYHTLLAATAAAAAALVALPSRRRSAPWVACLSACTVVFALREVGVSPRPPGWPWWTVATLLVAYAVMLTLAARDALRWPVWVATPAALCAATIGWLSQMQVRGREFTDLISLNALVLGLAAVCSVLVELRMPKHQPRALARLKLIGLHRFAVWLAIAAVALALLIDLFGYGPQRAGAYPWLPHLALGAVFASAVACLWDRHVRWPVAAFYLIGLAGIGRYLDALLLPPELLVWAFTLALSAFVLATSYVWGRREGFVVALRRLGVPIQGPVLTAGRVWLIAANSLASVLVTLLVFYVQVTDEEFSHRLVAAYGLLACALGLAFLATGRGQTGLRYAALCLGALFAMALAWAWAPPSIAAPLLHRLVASAVGLAAVTPVYGVGLVKLRREPNDWTRAAQKLAPALAALAACLLVATLIVETSYLVQQGAAPLEWPAVLAVAAALAGLAVSALVAAVAPGRDPFGLSERGRTVYVYAAEALLGLLFLHLRVTMPWLFGGWFAQFWPFIVMAIAFAGAGLSEWFRRRRQGVLAEPLANTGALLPLLPVIGFWSSSTAGSYALLLVAIGLFYTSLSVARKSPGFAALAVAALNGSLWTMLHSVEGLGLLQHPQFWLIPPALCLLAGAQLNRSRLTPEQLGAARYGAMIVVYASSTADIFLNGVGAGLWQPMALAALSIAGVMLGILLRVRAFLFLGLAFLCVSLFSVIWHAAVELERTWVWWIAGIVAGVAIIVLFGLFEKKRDEVLAVAERLKSWEA
ncbi:hypothetical protein [Pirellulimonas nuda]|uniref:hypothetical protein n=1 Tax=Pirellulimonas nuda TaxID=2528009 RepID=UPI0011A2F64A|nr:hypothetical protein [Pirellulimonas nuda]